MTNQHPITPPYELIEEWIEQFKRDYPTYYSPVSKIATQAAQWGADQELEACSRWIEDQLCMPPDARADVITKLNDTRRPKPLSLKQQALEELENMVKAAKDFGFGGTDPTAIRRVLEQLDD
jgi:hypothetical protein